MSSQAASLVIVSPENLDYPRLVPEMKELIQLGIQRIHLRFPNSTSEECEGFLSAFSSEEMSVFRLHQHHGLIQNFSLGGIHYTEDYRMGDDAFNTAYPGELSSSFHYPESLDWFLFDYVFCSPIFPSISKKGHTPEFGLADWQDALEEDEGNTPAIALGGIDPENAQKALSIGFSGIASLGYIWNSNSPTTNAKALLQAIS